MEEKTGMAVAIAVAISWAALFSCAVDGAPGSGGNCDRSQCPKRGITKFYSQLKCQPIFDDISCCPVRYDCSSFFSRNVSKCHFDGVEYEKSSTVPSNITLPNCIAACMCVGGERDFICAYVDCPEFFGAFSNRDPSCYHKYSLDSCCRRGLHCPKGTEEDKFQCEYDGQKYYKGQRFGPKDECKQCICEEGYDGTINGPWCQERQCSYELMEGQKLRRGCVPVYLENTCCPNNWHCPSENDRIIEGPNHIMNTSSTQENNKNELSCTFGNLKLNIADKLRPAGLDNVDCTCAIPPYLSCYLTPKE